MPVNITSTTGRVFGFSRYPPTLRVPSQQEDASHLGLARSNPQWGYLVPQAGKLQTGRIYGGLII